MATSRRFHLSSARPEPSTRRRRAWIPAAGMLLTLAALGGCGSPDRNDGASPKAPALSSPGSSTAKGSGTDGGRPTGCRTDDSDQRKPTAPPKDLYWKANGTHLVPLSKTAGPLKFDGRVWYCFARTPMGAVLAAHSIADKFGAAGWREVAERQVLPGPGRDAFITDRAKEEDDTGSEQPSGVVYAGFTVLSYDQKQATVMVLAGVPENERYASLSVNLRWHEGDWKVVPDPDGTLYGGGSRTDGTDGFVTWGT
ncbi:hypothetical protein ACFWIA_16370 [Streptomyces sp. NPDC127068]|uniref:hypothetical protein n=1 Tax=Streptomyces sp. NPDC127068 TaxID=3347127 RepID=UPI0036687148